MFHFLVYFQFIANQIYENDIGRAIGSTCNPEATVKPDLIQFLKPLGDVFDPNQPENQNPQITLKSIGGIKIKYGV